MIAGAFLRANMEFKKIPIYCPKCGYRVMNHDGITTIPIQSACKHCGAYIMYDPENQRIKYLDKVPLRASSSGRRFY